MAEHSLPRTERLRSMGAIRRLFESGESGFVFPFRYVWFAEPDTERSVEVRRTKEAYRLQKEILRSDRPVNIDLALVYSSKEALPYKTIAHAVRRILETIAAAL